MSAENTRDQIAVWLGGIASDEEVARLLGFSVGRLLMREGLHWRHKAETHRLDIMHVRDWLRTSVAEGAEWLARVDTHGRPKKLMKFGTFREMTAEADKAMRIAIQKLGKIDIDPAHERLHTQLADGYAMVEMLSDDALDRESTLMQHCIGNGGYDGDLAGDGHLLLSLRDPHGKPHATLRIDRGEGAVVELQGKQNKPPADRYMPYIREFLKATKMRLARGGESRLGLVQDVLGEWHDLHDLPDDLETRGSLLVADAPPFRMPSRLVVNGDFDAPGWMDRHPDILHVSGEYFTRFLPPVIGDFRAGSLTVSASQNFRGLLPGKLDVGKLTVISPNGLRIMPSEFEVTGSLVLMLNDRRQVPDDLRVGGELDIRMCTIRVWKGDVDCGGLNATVDKPMSFDGKVRVRGDLEVGGADVRLPNELRVSGNADFSDHRNGRKIEALPRRMFVGGDLDLERCEIGTMPSHLEVGGDLVVTDAVFDGLDGVKRVSGGLRMEGTSVRSLPPALTRVGGLWAAMSKLESLPDGFAATKSNLIVIGTPMSELPSGLFVKGNLFAGGNGIDTLPDDAVVRGRVHGLRVPAHMEHLRLTVDGRLRGRSLLRR
ncbi:PcfJ domain-containing protein [Pararhizobium sp. BT-229]|uniref:PcfJ domain-containing protein n=1 Tax=Pararhizobium sp. BT-229 TaxID=2986923 RepID=UPI0021F745D2|nr:PcfJ domain-containing protein [Pararhizobium sp. BT-229]MCV9963696.1 PcfJ domain-containing protein [Pararhizobium sp. BT-229]